MPKLTVVYAAELAKDRSWPPAMEAARYVGFCKSRGIDRVRVERVNGALVNEFSIPQLESLIRHYGMVMQPDKVAQPGVDYEPRPLIFAPGWHKEP